MTHPYPAQPVGLEALNQVPESIQFLISDGQDSHSTPRR